MLLHRRKFDSEDDENLDRWLLTYADMITLLLAFFVVLYSMSRVDAGKFEKITEALTTAFKGHQDLEAELKQKLSSKFTINKHLKRGDLVVLRKQIEKISQQLELGSSLNTEHRAYGLVIHVSESALFSAGEAKIRNKAKKMLDLIVLQLLKVPNHIRVEGHTDNLPINTEKYPSNWELSTFRATSCLRYLLKKHDFPPEKISALGYAEFRPLAPNDTEEGRAKNRRVDIVVLTLEDSNIEPENLTGDPVEALIDSLAVEDKVPANNSDEI